MNSVFAMIEVFMHCGKIDLFKSLKLKSLSLEEMHQFKINKKKQAV